MKILQLLDFTLHNPTRYEFLVYYAKMLQLTSKQEKFIIYLLTLTLSNYEFNYYPESAIAAAVVHYTLQVRRNFLKIFSLFFYKIIFFSFLFCLVNFKIYQTNMECTIYCNYNLSRT